jgi:hypothetical protein
MLLLLLGAALGLAPLFGKRAILTHIENKQPIRSCGWGLHKEKDLLGWRNEYAGVSTLQHKTTTIFALNKCMVGCVGLQVAACKQDNGRLVHAQT